MPTGTHEPSGLLAALLVQRLAQPYDGLPHTDPVVGQWVPAVTEVVGREQASPSRPRPEDTTADQAIDGGVGRAGQLVGVPEVGLAPAKLREPLDARPGIRVEVTLLLGEHLVQRVVYEGKRGAHGHGRSVSFDHCPIEVRVTVERVGPRSLLGNE